MRTRAVYSYTAVPIVGDVLYCGAACCTATCRLCEVGGLRLCCSAQLHLMLHQPLCIGELPMELADLRTRTHVHKQSGSQDVAARRLLRCSAAHYAGYTLWAQAIATSL
jgi:hypothetical protein